MTCEKDVQDSTRNVDEVKRPPNQRDETPRPDIVSEPFVFRSGENGGNPIHG